MNETVDAVEEMTPAVDGERLHISGLLVGFVSGLPQLVFPMVAAIFGVRKADNPVLIPIVIAVVLIFSLFFRWLAWLRFQYFVGEHDIRVEKGILNRTARSIPYECIQDVSIEQKPLARMMGLGEVKFETGGGDGDDAKLSFVTLEEANRLRASIRSRKAGVAVAAPADAPPHVEEDAHPIFAMDGKRVFVFGLYSFSLVIFAVLGGLAQQFDFLLPFDFWDVKHWIGLAEERGVSVNQINGVGVFAQLILAFGAITSLIFIGFATGVVRTILREHGFRLDQTAKGFRRRRGLFTLTDVIMPTHRVQAAIVQTGPFRKRRGWHSLKFVSLAQDSKEETNYVAAPFATLDEVWRIAIAAAIAAPDGDERMQRGVVIYWFTQLLFIVPVLLTAMAALVIFADTPIGRTTLLLLLLVLPGAFFWLDWRQYRFGLDDRQLYLKRGWWRQQMTIAPQVKVQSVEIAQGPLSRRQGLASVRFGIAGGTMEMIALPLATAVAIRDAVMEKVAAVDYSAINQSH
ncbi:PH domain-containing protein [Sphingorhabdus sp.]|uniref:PH domain-containing protein n=1 Tax=Sphingorhabdus sp. TaxID=1902408 RepID=UPI0037C9EF07